ncbi:GTP-binding protein [Streptomyces pseudogriseolus]|uniref:GTP-binding protein n=1 Tax=Streptomyces pseudogriseolus TaxID=36817 RepID=UPI003FA2E559
MDSDSLSDPPVPYVPATAVQSAKIVIAGYLGVGKTTLVGSVSQVEPLRMEERITDASVGVDDLRRTPHKTDTTVGMDYGRVHLANGSLVLYLFGTPGQTRFRDIWEGLTEGALGALVLVDTRSLEDSHAVLEFLEGQEIPYAVAINTFADAPQYPLHEVRQALSLEDHTPLTTLDARDRQSSVLALIALVEYLIARRAPVPLVEPLP